MRRRRGGGGAAGRAAAGETERQAVSGSSFRSVVFCCECQFVSAAAAKMKGEGPKEKGEVEEEECEESSKRGKKKKKRRRGNRLAEKTATTAPERDERPLFLSPFIRLRFMPPPLARKEPRLVVPRTSQLGRTCASAAGLLLGKAAEAAAAVFSANARGAVLLPATPRADDDAVFDEACIASIARERGCRDKGR